MGCGSGACGINIGQIALDAREAQMAPRADGHCCDGCADDAARQKQYGRNALLRAVHKVPIAMPAKSGALPKQTTGAPPGQVYPFVEGHRGPGTAESIVEARTQMRQLPQQTTGAPKPRLDDNILTVDTLGNPVFPWTPGHRDAASVLQHEGLSCEKWRSLRPPPQTILPPGTPGTIGGVRIDEQQVIASRWGVSVSMIDAYCAAVARHHAQRLAAEARVAPGVTKGVVPELPSGVPHGGKGGGGGGHGGGHGHGGHGHGHHGHGGFHGHGDGWMGGFNGIGGGGWYPAIDPFTYLQIMSMPAQTWCGLTAAQKIDEANLFEEANPGAIGDVPAFIAGMDAYCARFLPGYAYGPAPSMLRSGDLAWSASGTAAAGTAEDDFGYVVSIDASGNPIPGTVLDFNGQRVDDAALDTTGVLGHVQHNASAAELANIRGAWTTVGSLINMAGTDIAAVIAANDHATIARINQATSEQLSADRVAMTQAQHSGDAATVAQLQSQIAALQTVANATAQAQPQGVLSSPVAKVGIAAVVLAGLAKVFGYI